MKKITFHAASTFDTNGTTTCIILPCIGYKKERNTKYLVLQWLWFMVYWSFKKEETNIINNNETEHGNEY